MPYELNKTALNPGWRCLCFCALRILKRSLNKFTQRGQVLAFSSTAPHRSDHSFSRKKKSSLVAQAVKNLPQCRRSRFDPWVAWVGKILWRRKWQPTQVFLPEESHGQRRLAGYSPWGCKESDVTEGLILSTSLEVDTVRQFILLKEIIITTCGTLKFNVFLSEISKSYLLGI